MKGCATKSLAAADSIAAGAAGGVTTTRNVNGGNQVVAAGEEHVYFSSASYNQMTTTLYYSASWQVVEEDVGGETALRNVWSIVYADALVLRDFDYDGTGTFFASERTYALQDANFNVTALVTRFTLIGDGTQDAGQWDQVGQDMCVWVEGTVWYDNRHRIYSATMARFGQAEPYGAEYIDGANLYCGLAANPINRTDAMGLQWYSANSSKMTPNPPAPVLPPPIPLPSQMTELFIKGMGAYPYLGHQRFWQSTPIYIDATKIHGDLQTLLDQIRTQVNANGGNLVAIHFTGHGIDNADCKKGKPNEHYRGMELLDAANRGNSRGSPLVGSIEIENTRGGGPLTPQTQYFFQQLAALAPPGLGLETDFEACNLGRGPDGEAFLQDIANITRGTAMGFDREISAFGLPFSGSDWLTLTMANVITKSPMPPAPATAPAPASSPAPATSP